jgi:hypothetical protein
MNQNNYRKMFGRYPLLCMIAVRAVAADFIVYTSHEREWWGQKQSSWKIFDDYPSCHTVKAAKSYKESVDVSKRIGVRCKGEGCNGYGPIEELEMHFSSHPLIHLSMATLDLILMIEGVLRIDSHVSRPRLWALRHR